MMKRIMWEHTFPGRRQPTPLALYICPESDPWYIDGFLDVRMPAYRDDGTAVDRAVDEEIRGLVIDDVQESVEQNAGYCTFEQFCEEFGGKPMDVYHLPYTLKRDGKRCDIQVACPDGNDAMVQRLALKHLGLSPDQVVFDQVYLGGDMIQQQVVVVAPVRSD